MTHAVVRATPDMGFGEFLLRERRRAGLTQEELAERAGMTPRAISDLERGVVRRPRRRTVQNLAAALGVGAGDYAAFVRSASSGRSGAQVAPVTSVAAPVDVPVLMDLPVSVEVPAPAQLPADVTPFVGRRGEVAALDAWLAPDDGTTAVPVVLCGTAGVGKTALAVRWARRQALRFPDGQLFLPLHGGSPGAPVEPGDALATMIRSLDPDGGTLPAGLDERAAQFRTLVADRQLLVVLDDAVSLAQVRPLLPAGAGVRCLVTSRDRLSGLVAREGATRIEVERLSRRESVYLLHDLVGSRVTASRDALDEVARQCAHLPLALRLAAELAATRYPDDLTGLTAELEDARTRLDLLDADGDEESALRPLFTRSLANVPRDAVRMFDLMGVLPDGEWDLAALAALAGLPSGGATRAVNALARVNIVKRVGARRVGMHDLLRAFARDRAATLPEHARAAAVARMLAHYRARVSPALAVITAARVALGPAADAPGPIGVPGLVGAPGVVDVPRMVDARRQLDADRPGMLAVLDEALRGGPTPAAVDLLLAARRDLELAGCYDRAVTLLRRAAAVTRLLDDPVRERQTLVALGTFDGLRGDYPAAREHFAGALVLSDDDPVTAAQARCGLGLAALCTGDHVEARTSLEAALEAAIACGDTLTQASVLENLGSLHLDAGDLGPAQTFLSRAVELCRLRADVVGESISRTTMARVLVRQGRPGRALSQARRAMHLSRQTGDRRTFASALDSAGMALEASGHRGPASACRAEVRRLIAELGLRTTPPAPAPRGFSALP